MKFSFQWIWSHLLKKSLMENFIFCALWKLLLLSFFLGYEQNFKKLQRSEMDTLNFSYDVTSILQYGSYDYSISPNKMTISRVDNDVVIKPFYSLSKTDIEKVKRMYDCRGNTRSAIPITTYTLREKCRIWSFFWSVISPIQTKYEDLLYKSSYSVQIWKNPDLKKFLFTQR